MGCQKSLTINAAATGEVGLDGAVYDPVSGFIFGVAGQWVHKFSSTDGSLIASVRFADEAFGRSSITTVGGKIYLGVSTTPHVSEAAFQAWPLSDVYVVDSTLFTPGGALGLFDKLGFLSANGNFWWHTGYTLLENDGSNLFSWAKGELARFDPTNTATYTGFSFGTIWDMAYDADHSVMWITNPFQFQIWAQNCSPFLLASHTFSTPSTSHFISGITYCSSAQKVYVVDGTFALYMVDASNIVALIATSTHFPFTTLNTGRINANPFRIRACNGMPGNPYNNKVLIPTWADDAVVVWDPSTDTVASTKTGFSSPWDIVHAPTASFAIQTSATGLRKIT